jgi:hypothetical protein
MEEQIMALVSKISSYEFEVEYKEYKIKATLTSGFGVLNDTLDEAGWDIDFDKGISTQDKLIVKHYLDDYQGDYEAETIKIPKYSVTDILNIFNLNSWQECLIYQAVDFEFISINSIKRAVEILTFLDYKDADEFFMRNHESEDEFISSLVNATQI